MHEVYFEFRITLFAILLRYYSLKETEPRATTTIHAPEQSHKAFHDF